MTHIRRFVSTRTPIEPLLARAMATVAELEETAQVFRLADAADRLATLAIEVEDAVHRGEDTSLLHERAIDAIIGWVRFARETGHE